MERGRAIAGPGTLIFTVDRKSESKDLTLDELDVIITSGRSLEVQGTVGERTAFFEFPVYARYCVLSGCSYDIWHTRYESW